MININKITGNKEIKNPKAQAAALCERELEINKSEEIKRL